MGAQEEQALVESMYWRIASRDDAAVAQALASGAEVEEVYALEAGALLDGFWAFLGEVGVQDLLAGVTVAARARVIVPTIQVLLTYHLKILMGIASINPLRALLDAHNGMPVALLLVAEDAAESDYGLTLLGQAQANLGSASRLSEFVADRAYVDGPVLAEVDDLGIIFTVVLKDGICMREDARALVAAGARCRGPGPAPRRSSRWRAPRTP